MIYTINELLQQRSHRKKCFVTEGTTMHTNKWFAGWKRITILISIVVIVLAVFAIWYHTPIDLMDLASDEVSEIEVFDGNTGKSIHITDATQIAKIIDNLNDVKLKREKLSVGYMGYRFVITIYLSDGSPAGGWNDFIINSSDTIRKNPFFYTVVEGSIDYDYIDALVK